MTMEIIQQNIIKMQELDAKLIEELMKGNNFSDITKRYSEDIMKINCERIGLYLEKIDEVIYNSEKRKEGYYADGSKERSITIPLGEIKFKRTRYVNKKTGASIFLLDKYIGIDEKERMTDAVKARIVNEAIDTTYKKGGEVAAYNETYTKQTTKNIIEKINPDLIVAKNNASKKKVDYLYIDADEAHIKIQKDKNKKQVIAKEIYVYEGKEPEAPKSKRTKLKNKWTFAGVHEKSKENTAFWDEIRDYIDTHYEVSKINKIYLNADGGKWIKEGIDIFNNVVFVIDKYHLVNNINKMTKHLKDSQADAKQEIYEALKNGDIDKINTFMVKLYNTVRDDKKIKIINNCEKFLRNNLEAIKQRLNHKDEPILGCSAEAHISHDLASRMTTICRGWSISNADRMARLRAYKINGGNIYDLVKENHEAIRKKNKDLIKNKIIKLNKKEKERIYLKEKETIDITSKYYNWIQATIDNEVRKKYHLNY